MPCEKRNDVGRLTSSRREARNCWGDDFSEEIAKLCDEMASDTEIRVVILTGEAVGKAVRPTHAAWQQIVNPPCQPLMLAAPSA